MDTQGLRVLGEKYTPEIMLALDEPKTGQELSDSLDIPIATCYRRLEQLKKAGLIEEHEKRLTDERRRVQTYRRLIDGFNVSFESGINIETTDRKEVEDKLDEAWRELSKSNA